MNKMSKMRVYHHTLNWLVSDATLIYVYVLTLDVSNKMSYDIKCANQLQYHYVIMQLDGDKENNNEDQDVDDEGVPPYLELVSHGFQKVVSLL